MRKLIRDNLISIVTIIAIFQSIISIGVCSFWSYDFAEKPIVTVVLMIMCIFCMIMLWLVLYFMIKDSEYRRKKDDKRYVLKR